MLCPAGTVIMKIEAVPGIKVPGAMTYHVHIALLETAQQQLPAKEIPINIEVTSFHAEIKTNKHNFFLHKIEKEMCSNHMVYNLY